MFLKRISDIKFYKGGKLWKEIIHLGKVQPYYSCFVFLVCLFPSTGGNTRQSDNTKDRYNKIMLADQTHECKSQDTLSSNPPNYFNLYEIAELGQAAWGLSAADFNHDGKMDFVAAYADVPFTHSTISIFYNNGNLSFTKDDVFTLDINYINDVVAGDFNNDGNIDILFTYDEWIWYQGLPINVNGTANILFNDGTNHFGNLTMVVHRGNGVPDIFGRINPKIAAADYDMDGDLDFLLGDNSGQVEFFLNNGNANFTSAESSMIGAMQAGVSPQQTLMEMEIAIFLSRLK